MKNLKDNKNKAREIFRKKQSAQAERKTAAGPKASLEVQEAADKKRDMVAATAEVNAKAVDAVKAPAQSESGPDFNSEEYKKFVEKLMFIERARAEQKNATADGVDVAEQNAATPDLSADAPSKAEVTAAATAVEAAPEKVAVTKAELSVAAAVTAEAECQKPASQDAKALKKAEKEAKKEAKKAAKLAAKAKRAEKKAAKAGAAKNMAAAEAGAQSNKEGAQNGDDQKNGAQNNTGAPAKKQGIWAGMMSDLEDAGAAIIYLHDNVQASVDRFFSMIVKSWAREYDDAHRRYKGTTKKMMQGFFSLIIVTCMLLLVFEHFTTYEYAYNGRVLGYVKNQDTVVDVLDVSGQELSSKNNAKIVFKAGDNITLKKVPSFNKDTDDADEVLNNLTYMKDVEVKASGIYEDGKLKVIVESEGVAHDLLDKVQASYKTAPAGMSITGIGFKGSVEVKPLYVMVSSIKTGSAAENILKDGGAMTIKHIAEDGETLDSIAKTFDVKTSEIFDASGESAVKKVSAGDSVTINKTSTPICVKTEMKGTMAEAIPYKVEEEKTKDLYKGDSYVKQKGADGKRIVNGTIYYENGKEVKRNIKKTTVISEPTTQIVLIGTAERPKTAPTGHFKYPVRNINITSPYGYRWGRLHTGVDLANPIGTPIYASDGGTVTVAGYEGAYGLCVIVDHGNGFKTRYAHCNQLYVSVGDKVYQGQEISATGNTGRSTGPHLHFEIIVNGAPVDPMGYLE